VPSWKEIVRPVEPFLRAVSIRLEEQVAAFLPEIATYAQYALSSQGKQLRPSLVCLSGGTADKPNDPLVTVAVIIEMVHLATLVHDDIMDHAVMRRRRPTLAANWGNQISVLLGDCLFAHALKLAASFPTPDICRAVANATNTVCSGEILQTLRRGRFHLTLEDYFKVVEMKTGELFALSCELGGALCLAPPPHRAGLREYGMKLGTAYQLYDDCLDLFGNEDHAGKSLGTDLAGGKLTLPVILARDQASKEDQSALQELLHPWQPANHTKLQALLEHYNALTGSREIIANLVGEAKQALNPLGHSESKLALLQLAEFLAQQTRRLGVQP